MSTPVTIVQELMPVAITTESTPVSVIQEQNTFTLEQGLYPVTIQSILSPPLTIQGGEIMSTTILPFSVTATVNNQSVFTIQNVYTSIICLFVMGVAQDILDTPPDYSVNGNQITIPGGLPIGYRVYGAGQL